MSNEQHASLIVLEGLDGSGKQTQSELLVSSLRARGLRAESISFPWYGEPSAATIEEYLAGVYGTNPGDVGAYGASLFYAADRFASYRKHWKILYESCDVLVSDRYVGSNAIHQCAKLPKDEWEGFVDWLTNLEFARVGLPEPDVTVYLRVDPAVSESLLSGRYGGDESKKDIHEADAAYLAGCREAADWCAERLGWRVVECAAACGMRGIADIHAEVMAILGRSDGGTSTGGRL